jgi:hypothetical protein
MDHVGELSSKRSEFIAWMEKDVVPTLAPDYQTSFFNNVKTNWLKAEAASPPPAPNPLAFIIGPRCLKMYDDLKHVLHYLEKTAVPREEIAAMTFFPRENLIDNPERMFREAARPLLVIMFKYFVEFGRLYYRHLCETDPVLASMVNARKERKEASSKGGGAVDSK